MPEWCVAAEWPIPMQPRRRRGIFSRPLLMYCILAIWLTTSPTASNRKSANMKSTTGLFDRFGPDRLCDTPIAERGFVGLACGAAMTGTRPVIDFMFADFVLDGVGEIVNQIAKMQYMSSGRLEMPLLLRGCVGIGHSAATHHSGNY